VFRGTEEACSRFKLTGACFSVGQRWRDNGLEGAVLPDILGRERDQIRFVKQAALVGFGLVDCRHGIS